MLEKFLEIRLSAVPVFRAVGSRIREFHLQRRPKAFSSQGLWSLDKAGETLDSVTPHGFPFGCRTCLQALSGSPSPLQPHCHNHLLPPLLQSTAASVIIIIIIIFLIIIFIFIIFFLVVAATSSMQQLQSRAIASVKPSRTVGSLAAIGAILHEYGDSYGVI